MNNNILNRKGASRTIDVPSDVLALLNTGSIASVNLTEWLVTDQLMLAKNLLPKIGYEYLLPELEEQISQEKKPTTKKVSEIIAHTVLKSLNKQKDRIHIREQLSKQTSDSARCWAAYLIGFDESLSIAEKLQQMQTFAADEHFGVREIAWLALRADIINSLPQALEILEKWTTHDDENMRRFASEATRPRGVWCAHITALKQQPGLAQALLESLKSDPAKYVRDSVGNWLNDASKDQADWVKTTCQRWQNESDSKETAYIIKRALRTINK
jgi:3-methyladenine DNA glycosylase AlkC